MEGLVALVKLLIYGPIALFSARYEDDPVRSVYGMPARFMGLLVVNLICDIPLGFFCGDVNELKGIMIFSVVNYFVTIILLAVMMLVFGEQRRSRSPPPDPPRSDMN